MFLFFTIVLGWVSLRLMPETASVFARHVGGIFIYGMSVIDAYKLARVNWERWKFEQMDQGRRRLIPSPEWRRCTGDIFFCASS